MEQDLIKKFEQIKGKGAADGLWAAIHLFTQKNKYDVNPSEFSKNPLDDFLLILTDEIDGKDNPSYPYQESIALRLKAVLSEYSGYLSFLMLSRDFELAERLVCTIVSGETLDFLHKNSAATKSAFEKIRSLPSGGPHG